MQKENNTTAESCQFVGPYRLEKTLGKGQTGEFHWKHKNNKQIKEKISASRVSAEKGECVAGLPYMYVCVSQQSTHTHSYMQAHMRWTVKIPSSMPISHKRRCRRIEFKLVVEWELMMSWPGYLKNCGNNCLLLLHKFGLLTIHCFNVCVCVCVAFW